MRCDEVQETLWPLEESRRETPETRRARAHLERCERCRGFFERDRAVGELLRRLRRQGRAPAALRERVYSSLAIERSRPPARAAGSGWRRARELGWTVALPLAAAAALVLGLALGSPDGEPVQLTRPAHFANDYLRLAVQEEVAFPPVESAAVSAFFLRELGHGVTPVVVPGATVTRAMVCLLGGRRGAMVEYDLGGARLAHYRIPLDPSETGTARPVELSTEMGLAVARWTDGEFENALVGELSAGQLERLAAERFVKR